jgi:hypothetical protein
MKLIVSIQILFTLFFAAPVFAQASTAGINKNWTQLKIQLRLRANIVVLLTNELGSYKKISSDRSERLQQIAKQLREYLDKLKQVDSNSVLIAFDKNSKLSNALTSTLVTFQNDLDFGKEEKLVKRVLQIESIDNTIVSAVKKYNDTCKKYNRRELFFGDEVPQKAPEVRFD